jgi:hypothetical protein
MGSIREFLGLARRRPLTAAFLALATAATSVGLEVARPKVENYIKPSRFSNLSSDYVGTIAEGGAFHLCFVAFGSKVLGEMTFEGGGTHVDYWGDVDKDRNQLTLRYVRETGSSSPDHGVASLSEIGENDLQGFYQSSVYPDNHQALNLERTGQACDLKHFDHGW